MERKRERWKEKWKEEDLNSGEEGNDNEIELTANEGEGRAQWGRTEEWKERNK